MKNNAVEFYSTMIGNDKTIEVVLTPDGADILPNDENCLKGVMIDVDESFVFLLARNEELEVYHLIPWQSILWISCVRKLTKGN